MVPTAKKWFLPPKNDSYHLPNDSYHRKMVPTNRRTIPTIAERSLPSAEPFLPSPNRSYRPPNRSYRRRTVPTARRTIPTTAEPFLPSPNNSYRRRTVPTTAEPFVPLSRTRIGRIDGLFGLGDQTDFGATKLALFSIGTKQALLLRILAETTYAVLRLWR